MEPTQQHPPVQSRMGRCMLPGWCQNFYAKTFTTHSEPFFEIFRIKPYIVSKHLDQERNVPQHFPCDKARIFAKAISNAQPFEKVDIMICRQSL